MTKQKRTPRLLKLPAAVAFGVASLAGLFANQAQAQWVVVDPSHIAQDAANFATTVGQYAKEIAQYQAVLQHYAQQLISLQNMSFSMPSMNTTFTEVPLTQGVEEACPSDDGVSGIVGSLLQLAAPDFNKPIVASQHEICQQITMRRNHQYNLTVQMLNRLQGPYSQYLQTYEQLASAVGSSQGALAGSQANIVRGTANLDTEMRNWQAQIQTDVEIIKYLEMQQAILGKTAMRGSNTILGNIVQAATLKIAFDKLNNGN